MSKVYKKLLTWFYKPYVNKRIQKESRFNWNGLDLVIHPGVFHPGFFYSSKYLASYLQTLDLNKKSFLEIGCGSGLVSIVAAKAGANVTAVDISKSAVENTRLNFENNNTKGRVLESDLLDTISNEKFDYIVVNPPYYPNEVKEEKDHAWNCGVKFEYFKRLFKEVQSVINNDSLFLMILSDECDLNNIKSIALDNDFQFQLLDKRKIQLEWNYIYKIYR